MPLNIQQERQQAHALLDLLPAAKIGAVRGLLEVMVDEDGEELTVENRAAIQAGIDSLASTQNTQESSSNTMES